MIEKYKQKKEDECMEAMNKPQEAMIVAKGMTEAFVKLLASEKRPETYWNDCLDSKKKISSSAMSKLKEMCNGDK